MAEISCQADEEPEEQIQEAAEPEPIVEEPREETPETTIGVSRAVV